MSWWSSLGALVLANAVVATLLALLVVVAEQCWPRRHALLHGLWVVVMARLVMPPLWTPEVLLVTPAPGVAGGTLSQLLTTATPPIADLAPTTATAVPLTAWIVGTWLAISCGMALFTAARIRRLRQRFANCRPPSASDAERWQRLAARLGMDTPPALGFSDGRFSPMLVAIAGWARVVVPTGLWNRLTEPERDALLLHELAHFKRRDHWLRHLEILVLAIFWWHPVAWWACRRLRHFEELVCDRLVVASAPEHRRAYADGLLKAVRYAGARPGYSRALACGLNTVDALKGRLEMIFRNDRPTPLPIPLRLAIGLAVGALLTATPMVTAESADEPPAAAVLDIAAQDTTLNEVLIRIAEVSDLHFVILPGVDQDHLVTMHAKGVPWDEALDHLMRVVGLETTREGDVLWIHRPLDGDSGQTGKIAPLGTLLHGTTSGLSTIQLERHSDNNVTLDTVPWDQELDAILRLEPLSGTYENGRLVLRPTSSEPDC